MKQPVRFVSILLPVLLWGCGIEAPPPALSPPRATPEPPLSTMSLSLMIPAAEIAAFINAESQRQLANLKDQDVRCPFGHCRLDLIAFRTGPAQVSALDGQVAVRLPFRVAANLKGAGLLAFTKAEGDAEGVANAATPISLEPDWKLHSQLTGRIELSHAHLRVGPLVTNVAEIWDQGGQSLEKPIWRALDGEISKIALKQDVEALWTKAFAPIAVSRKPLSWLVLRPQRLALMQPEIGHGALTLSLALTAQGEVLVQDRMPLNPAMPLPSPTTLSEASNRFSVAIPFLLSYAQAGQLALSSLKRHPPRVAGMTLAFSSLRILPSAEDVVVETRFCGRPDWDFTGWLGPCAHIYLRGAPLFDPATRTMRVTGLHYDIASANVALEILHAALSSKFTAAMARTLVFDMSRQIGHEESQLRAELAKPHGKTLSLSADVQSFGAPSFTWTKDGFLALFSATGAVTAVFKL